MIDFLTTMKRRYASLLLKAHDSQNPGCNEKQWQKNLTTFSNIHSSFEVDPENRIKDIVIRSEPRLGLPYLPLPWLMVVQVM